MELEKFINLFNYIKSFEKNDFQGIISYQRIEKRVMLYELFCHFQLYIFLKNKQSNEYVNIDRYYQDFHQTFDNVNQSEQSIVDLYTNINQQSKYIRNVQILAFIIYKENWNVADFDKAVNQKYYINKLIKKFV